MPSVIVYLSIVIDTDEEPGEAVDHLAEALSGLDVDDHTSIASGTVEVDNWDTL